MTQTHILVDFENVQPPAADIALVRGEQLRLAIFRGPGQMKYSADVAEAWQPLGASLTFVRCAKAGRNAVDMHIAFYLGELVAAQGREGAAPRARFVIVSRDTDFDPLLMHIRNQGFDATRVASIRAALGGSGVERVEPRAAKSRSGRGKAAEPAAAAPAAAPKPARRAAKKSAVAKKAPTAAKAPTTTKAPATKAPAAKRTAALVSAPAPAPAPRAPRRAARVAPAADAPAAATAAAADGRAKVIDSLVRMGEKRPTKRKGLERHIESHLGRKLEPGQLEALMAQLERDGVLAFNDNKVEYRLPKAKK